MGAVINIETPPSLTFCEEGGEGEVPDTKDRSRLSADVLAPEKLFRKRQKQPRSVVEERKIIPLYFLFIPFSVSFSP